MLTKAINALELDRIVTTLSPQNIKAGKFVAVNFGGVAWAAFNNLEKPGKITLNIKDGLPAAKQGFLPGWPIVNYNFNFDGILAEDGYIDINFYIGGINFSGYPSGLRIFEWDGKSYKDITTIVDVGRRIITGRAQKLGTYVIMCPPVYSESIQEIKKMWGLKTTSRKEVILQKK
jgi:hypothetical protein